MIVDTMSMKDVGEAVLKTVQCNLMKIAIPMLKMNKKYRRIILKGGDKRIDFMPIRTEADGITFYLCPYSLGKRDTKKYSLVFGLFAHFFYRGTNWYALLCDDNRTVNLYNQHFFKRYIMRHLKDGRKVSIDTVRHYFKETDYLTNCQIKQNPRHKNCIYGATNIGVCCGYYCGSKRITVWKTYIDQETLSKGDKKEVFDDSADKLIPIGMDGFGQRIFKNEVPYMRHIKAIAKAARGKISL